MNRTLLLTALIGSMVGFSCSAQEIGVVKTVNGQVLIERGSGTLEPQVGTPLMLDDRVLTAAQSSFGAALHDGTTLALGGGSQVEIARFAFEPGEGVFDLLIRILGGQMVYRGGRIGEARPDRVEIETPRLSIATRGTRFAVVVPAGTLPEIAPAGTP